MNRRFISFTLLALLALLQYPLWFGKGGLMRVHELEQQLAQQRKVNETLRLRNQQLEGDVRSLRDGVEAVEERARNDFGMVKPGETFIQLIDPKPGVTTSVPSIPGAKQAPKGNKPDSPPLDD
ncbi:MAG TPA: cell division protein FtsB [Limnobacter sp.]|uniref:cell division protein FtsB n=1 Tax=Limnobacter sp. TaxID=2003368 RepID=UPI002ED77D2E